MNTSARESTVYLFRDSNQAKLVDNLNPTSNDDIRYASRENKLVEKESLKNYNKHTKYKEIETQFMIWSNGLTPVGEVKSFPRLGKHRFYEKTENGCIELSRKQYEERKKLNAKRAYGRAISEISKTNDIDGSAGNRKFGNTNGNRNEYAIKSVHKQTIGEELRINSGGSISNVDGSSSGDTVNYIHIFSSMSW